MPPRGAPRVKTARDDTRRDNDALRLVDNVAFTRYYRDLQQIVPADKWDEFTATMRTPLPTTLWINDTDPLAATVGEVMSKVGSAVACPIPWYPLPGMAWRITADKKTFRQDASLKPLRQFLIRQTAMGTISRQEEVSMLPPMLLDIQPTDKCLDMCASPGSKTAQMLVALGRWKRRRTVGAAEPFPFDYLSQGMIVANEIDEKRANMLVHQVKRLRQLFPFALFCNHDARSLPPLTAADGSELSYDKVLCDVVCTGDGTLRKAPHMFKSWQVKDANNLQRLQIDIALRGCHLLKVGGRMVYSTCSLNPIENEAVVYALLQRTSGAMRVVDASSLLPGLRFNPGMKSWAVVANDGTVVKVPGELSMHASCFPPAAGVDAGLEKCMRILPEHCEGGGFFIAVLEKVAPYSTWVPPTVVAAPAAAAVDSTDAAAPAVVVPPTYAAVPVEMREAVENFFEAKGFPADNLVVRLPPGETTMKLTVGMQCSLVSNDVRDVLASRSSRLIAVSAGLRLLASERLGNHWRIAQEAAPLFEVLMATSKRMVPCTIADVVALMKVEPLKDLMFDDLPSAELRTAVEPLEVGALLLRIVDAKPLPIICAGLRARTRLQLLVDGEDAAELRCRLGLEVEEAAATAEETTEASAAATD